MDEDRRRGNPGAGEHDVPLRQRLDLRGARDFRITDGVRRPHSDDGAPSGAIAHELHGHGHAQKGAHMLGRAGQEQRRKLRICGVAPNGERGVPLGHVHETRGVGVGQARRRSAQILLHAHVGAVGEYPVERHRITGRHSCAGAMMDRMDFPPPYNRRLSHVHESAAQNLTGAAADEQCKVRLFTVLPGNAHI